jgi:ABC-2 type transport system permease protein
MSPRRLAWRQIRRSAQVWAAAVFLMLVAGAAAYRAGFPDQAARERFAATTSGSSGLRALYGKAWELDTVGGFVTWRYGTTLAAVLALWAGMVTSRLLRGEEELGRAEPLLAGPRGPRRLLGDQLLGIGAGIGLITLATTAGGVAAQLPVRVSVYLGLQVLASMVFFAGLTAAISQVVATRRRCLGVVGAVLGLSYLLRAVGDGSAHGQVLVWMSPLGWFAELSAYSGRAWLPALPLLLGTALLLAATSWLRVCRDAGAGTWTWRAHAPRARRITSLARLEVVLGRGALVGWTLGMAVAGLLLGFIAADIAKVGASNAGLSALDDVAGASIASVRGFLGLAFQLVAVVGALYAGSQLISARREEESHHLENLLTAGVGRRRWLATRLVAISLSALLMTATTGLAVWVGVRASGEVLPLQDAMAAAVNTLPLAALFLGLATLTFGAWPRAVHAVAFGSVGASYFVLILAAVADAPSWFMSISPLSHLAAVPAVSANLAASVWLSVIALALCAAGAVAFSKRDAYSE